MFLISSCLEGYTGRTEIQPGYRSDHSIITLHLDISKQSRGRGLFKFNASLLNDSKYVSMVKSTIKTTVCEYALPIYREEYIKHNPTEVQLNISSSLFLEVLLLTLRRETVSFGIRKKQQERKDERNLESEIIDLERKNDELGSREISDELQQKKKELEVIREKMLRGCLVRSRAMWRESSEKPSKYFLTLEKRRYESKRISCIRTSEGTKRNQTEILKAFQDFFQRRFRQPDQYMGEEDCQRYVSETLLTKLEDLDKHKLEKPITQSELGVTLYKMKNGTAPGSDGFSVEFYKFFWADLKGFVQAMCDESFTSGSLPQTLKEGIIVLLPKANKPRDLVESYRPITLLNVCYKIISSTIANRLKEVMQNIIGTCQSAYLKGRFIGDNIRMIYDTIQLMKQEQTSGILLSLDIEAAFDSVSWTFIRRVLEVRDFPPNILKWFDILYKGSFSRVIYNGHISGKIELTRSCRQGDALSCYLFILVMDVIAKRIQSNNEIRGIGVANEEQKILMYADDTVCFIEPNERCIRKLFQELGWFAKFSGLRPNIEKTQAMWIGSGHKDTDIFESNVNLQWCKAIKILGVTFDNSLNGMADVYKEKVNNIKREMAKWMKRNISLTGKVTIIKSLLVAKISYLFMTIPDPPQSIVKDLNTALFKFLWHGKGEKIKRSTVTKESLKGGAGMLDLACYMKAMKITWIRRYITKHGAWRTIASANIGSVVEFWLLGHAALRKKAGQIKNKFWREVLTALADFKEGFVGDLTASPIFFSDVTKFKYTWIKDWYENGVRTLNDLLRADGTVMEYDEWKEMFNINATILDYTALLRSLPIEWKDSKEKRKLDEPSLNPSIAYIVSKKGGASHICRILVESKTKHQDNIWERAWDIRLNELNWTNIYECLKYTPVQYRSMRYKIITRIVGTNSLLEKMKIKSTDSCEECLQRENIEHKFWYCRRVKNFWNEIKAWLIGKRLSRLSEKINIVNIILGGEDNLIINHIVSVGVYMIYVKKPLTVTMLQFILRSDYNSEKYCAKLNDREKELSKKWMTLNLGEADDLNSCNGLRGEM